MKTLRLLIVMVMLNLATGCATCRQSSDAQAASSTEKVPWWQYVVGFVFGLPAASAYAFADRQQSNQSGDPAR